MQIGHHIRQSEIFTFNGKIFQTEKDAKAFKHLLTVLGMEDKRERASEKNGIGKRTFIPNNMRLFLKVKKCKSGHEKKTIYTIHNRVVIKLFSTLESSVNINRTV